MEGPCLSVSLSSCLFLLVSNPEVRCSPNAIAPLLQRFKQLEAAQKKAQTMQYGIWKDWQEDKLTDRVFSAGKRVTSRGFQKLVRKVTGSE
jgi:hypothetical protein